MANGTSRSRIDGNITPMNLCFDSHFGSSFAERKPLRKEIVAHSRSRSPKSAVNEQQSQLVTPGPPWTGSVVAAGWTGVLGWAVVPGPSCVETELMIVPFQKEVSKTKQ